MTDTALDDHTRWVPVTDLQEHPANPKDHSVPELRASMQRLGFMDPLVVDGRTGLLIAGHGRRKALLAMAADGEDPPDGVRQDGDVWLVPVFEGWASADDDEALTALVALNRLTETGGWHAEPLVELLDRLAGMDAGLVGTGYDDSQLDDLRARLEALAQPDTDEDDDLEPRPDPTAQLGDVWQVGPHRIVCGDAADPAAYALALNGQPADMVWTDPPYGVAVASRIGTVGVSSSQARSEGHDTIANDDFDVESLTAFLRTTLAATKDHTKPGAAWYVAAPHGPTGLAFSTALYELEVWRHSLVWIKDSLVLGRADYHYRHEFIYYGWTPGAAHYFAGDRTNDTVWEVPRPRRSEDHPTMKPLALIMEQIRNSSRPGEVVLDPFAGSGSTLVAAHRLGRVGVGVELDSRYVDVVVRRLAGETGETPERLEV